MEKKKCHCFIRIYLLAKNFLKKVFHVFFQRTFIGSSAFKRRTSAWWGAYDWRDKSRNFPLTASSLIEVILSTFGPAGGVGGGLLVEDCVLETACCLNPGSVRLAALAVFASAAVGSVVFGIWSGFCAGFSSALAPASAAPDNIYNVFLAYLCINKN